MRSLLDPLPRTISTGPLIGLVLLVLLGTGVTVERYIETAPSPVQAQWNGEATSVHVRAHATSHSSSSACRKVDATIESPEPTVHAVDPDAHPSVTTGGDHDVPALFEPPTQSRGS